MNTIVVFEDNDYKKLYPLVYSRPVYGLKCGISTILEKMKRRYHNTNINLFCRDYLAEIVNKETGLSVNKTVNDNCLFINGRVLMDKAISVTGKEEIGVKDDIVLYARLSAERSRNVKFESVLSGEVWKKLRKEVKTVKAGNNIITYTWDLINHNAEQIKLDFKELIKEIKISGKIYPGVHLLNESQIHVGRGSIIKPGVVLGAEKGPIYIGNNVEILSNAVIEGPVAIGDGSIVRIGAKIREGTSIGEVCRVGGEVEDSIIHGYSNKQHEGFLGHAYLGKWCNLGAGTNNSDLKNNYSMVKVYVDGKFIDSNLRFVGLAMADHSKTGIGTMFDTGTVVGYSVNVYGAGLQPKYIASFAWGGLKGVVPYDARKAIETARIVMERRKVKISAAEEKLFHKIYRLTEQERKDFIQQLRF